VRPGWRVADWHQPAHSGPLYRDGAVRSSRGPIRAVIPPRFPSQETLADRRPLRLSDPGPRRVSPAGRGLETLRRTQPRCALQLTLYGRTIRCGEIHLAIRDASADCVVSSDRFRYRLLGPPVGASRSATAGPLHFIFEQSSYSPRMLSPPGAPRRPACRVTLPWDRHPTTGPRAARTISPSCVERPRA